MVAMAWRAGFLVVLALVMPSLCAALTFNERTSIISQLSDIQDISGSYCCLRKAYLSSLGLSLMQSDVRDKKAACAFIHDKLSDITSLEHWHYAVNAALLMSCPVSESSAVSINSIVNNAKSPNDIYYAASIAAALKKSSIDVKLLLSKVMDLIATEPTSPEAILSLGLLETSMTSAQSTAALAALKSFFETADEGNDMIDFNSNLHTTALGTKAAFMLYKKATPEFLGPKRIAKLATFFLSLRSTRSLTSITDLLIGLDAIAQVAPLDIVKSASKGHLVEVSVCDILGNAVKNTDVKVTAVVDSNGVDVSASNVLSSLQKKAGDATLYEYNVNTFTSGRYVATITAGSVEASFSFTVRGSVTISTASLSLIPKGKNKETISMDLNYPTTVLDIPVVDRSSQVSFKFTIKPSSTGEPLALSQAFVRFVHVSSKHQSTFAASSSKSNSYTLDIGGKEAFPRGEGEYLVEVLLGDSTLMDAILWHAATVSVKISGSGARYAEAYSELGNEYYSIKPELQHTFNEESRPARSVEASVFSVIVIIVPLLILVIGWLNIGANIYNFSFSLAAVSFQAGLVCIFSLFITFWVSLTMLETLKYLIPISGFTVVAGKFALGDLAAQRVAVDGKRNNK